MSKSKRNSTYVTKPTAGVSAAVPYSCARKRRSTKTVSPKTKFKKRGK